MSTNWYLTPHGKVISKAHRDRYWNEKKTEKAKQALSLLRLPTAHHDNLGEEKASESEIRERMQSLIDKELTYREREVIKLRFGMSERFPGKILTLNEIGKLFKVTGERVRGLEAHALQKLQHPCRKKPLEGLLGEERK